MREFDAVLFDMDGTLVDSEPLHSLAWTKTLDAFGAAPSRSDWVDEYVGKTDAETLRGILGMFPDLGGKDGILDRKHRIFRELVAARGTALIMPGVLPALRALRAAGVPLAVGTNGIFENCRAMLDAAGILPYFSALSTLDRVARGKPAPDIYLEAARSLKCAPERCIVVEDSDTGALAGKAAGCRVAGIASSAPKQKLDAADIVLPDSAAAMDWILDRFARGRGDAREGGKQPGGRQ